MVIEPKEYKHALKNPLKGFRTDRRDGSHEYVTLSRCYLKWNELENVESDGIDRIISVCNQKWRDAEKHNIKIIPRVYLHWDGDKKYWPEDMVTDDYSSPQFKERLLRLIDRLGKCWDDDPRVAWVQMGLIGKWGEHHSPDVSEDMQKLLGDAFTSAFKNKIVTVRHPWDFTDYEFGIYWDSWAHIQQVDTHGKGIEKLGDRWKTRPIGGECAYNWGKYKEQPGDSPDDTLTDPNHRDYLINSIRRLHGSNLGWVAEYDHQNSEARAGAAEVQKAFGYRFVIDQVNYPLRVHRDEPFQVSFTVHNEGSAPIYYNWPVEVSLLDRKTRKVIWSDTFHELDIRTWLPGDKWNEQKQKYDIQPEVYQVKESFTIPTNIDSGEYILALAILDPAGMLPSVRFAIENYFKGGRHPIGFIGIDADVKTPSIDPEDFDDPAKDRSLHYIWNGD